MRWLALLLLFAMPALADPFSQVVTLPTRPDVTQRFLFLKPEHPVASVVLFAGGEGNLRINDDGSLGWGRGNFLVRTRDQWLAQGFQVAVVDAPSDRTHLGLGRFRNSANHAEDISAVIHYLKQQAKVPVWLIGTSRGTTSAAAVATRLNDQHEVDGVVLTSSILNSEGAVTALPLARLKIPVLVVHHRYDNCFVTPYGQVSQLLDDLSGTTAQLITIEGGRNEGDACEAWAYHGYNGVENAVVEQAGAWIKAHPPR